MNEPPKLKLTSDDGEVRVTTVIDVKKYRYDEKQCGHNHLEIDENKRQLICVDCKAVLDPIAWLVEWSRKKESVHYQAKRIEEVRFKEWQQRQRERREGVKSYKAMWNEAEWDAAHLRTKINWLVGIIKEAAEYVEGMGNLPMANSLRDQCIDATAFPKAFDDQAGRSA